MIRAPYPKGYIEDLDILIADMMKARLGMMDSEDIQWLRAKVTAFVRQWGRPLHVYDTLASAEKQVA